MAPHQRPLSLKGPVRLWWTSDDVPAVSPHPCLFEEAPDSLESINSEFDAWCRSRYTNPQSGVAQLVVLRDVDRERIHQSLTEFRRQHRHVELWPSLRSEVALSRAE
jgi:hypothetical protein